MDREDSRIQESSCLFAHFLNPEVVGGWNLINMTLWNQVVMLKLLWDIFFKVDKLWVQWINAYYLRRFDINNVVISNNISWILRKIVKSMDLIEGIGGCAKVIVNGKLNTKKSYRLLQGSIDHVQWQKTSL